MRIHNTLIVNSITKLTMINLRALFRQILAQDHQRLPFPRSRNLILDIMREGRRKNIIHALFEADITNFQRLRAEQKDRSPTVTAFVSHCFCQTLGDDLAMQAYRSTFGHHLVIFDEVDLVVLIEQEMEGAQMPWTKTIRAANHLNLAAFSAAMKTVKEEPPARTQKERYIHWLMRQPGWFRRLNWMLSRHSPFFHKFSSGTVAVTSMGMFTQGRALVLPITPMTLTLSIGAIDQQWVEEAGQLVCRDRISLNLSADHDVIDGAPLMRFVDAMKKRLADPGLSGY